MSSCREAGVDQIALLGDLFDRVEQADGCARALAGWSVVGVWGNHEREIVLDAAEHGALATETVALLTGLGEIVVIEDVCLLHEAAHWGRSDALARVLGRSPVEEPVGHHARARITFAGHTHYRSARDERGPLDVARGSLSLDPVRRYLINPGALAAGQFAVWDREAGVIRFREV